MSSAAHRSPVRRLFLTADTATGTWGYAVELARGLARYGVATTLAVLGPRPAPAETARARAVRGLELVAAGLPSEAAHDRPGETRFAADALADLAAASGADLIQVNSPALAAADAFRAPVIAVAHGCDATWWAAVHGATPPAGHRWRTDLARDGYARCAAAVAPTAAFAAATAEVYGRRPIVVRGGRRAALAPSAGAEAGEPFVMTTGRLWDAGEDLETLDRAAARIGAPVVAAGDLRGARGEQARFERLSTPGPLDPLRIGQLLRTRPVYVSAARYAPDAPGALAAAQAGCALVLSDVPAHRELWAGGALFFSPTDAGACADAVNRLLAEPALRAERGAAARARAGRYSADAMTRGMLGVYRSVVAAPPASIGRRTTQGEGLSVALG